VRCHVPSSVLTSSDPRSLYRMCHRLSRFVSRPPFYSSLVLYTDDTCTPQPSHFSGRSAVVGGQGQEDCRSVEGSSPRSPVSVTTSDASSPLQQDVDILAYKTKLVQNSRAAIEKAKLVSKRAQKVSG
jgi:hypothetical protein